MEPQTIVNYIKGLVIDGVNQAQSGHPGGAMSSADFATLLFRSHLRFDPEDPTWLGRDRFVLSAGHESMLLYSLLHAVGYLPMAELKHFRQLGSLTPGHPESHLTPGVECTTGPLGQGAAMSVGFAIAESHMRATLDDELFSAWTWVLLGDGCMQEGVTLSSASLAGHLGLGHLIWYYDKNRQQISGDISRVSSDDEEKIFAGMGWQVLQIDGHDHEAIHQAIAQAKAEESKPTLIIGSSIMARGAATMEGLCQTHGAPLPKEELLATKKRLGIPEEESFYWPDSAATAFRDRFDDLRGEVTEWQQKLTIRKKDEPFTQRFAAFFDQQAIELSPIEWNEAIATRSAFGKALAQWAEELPQLIGGSADLEPSNMTAAFAKSVGDFKCDNPAGRNIPFGVREFPMAAICNGLALYGGFIPFDATFLVFTDYARSAIRLGAIQGLRVIHEMTHDSFYLGEDGPTHQPVEHLMSLRAMPETMLMRPADAHETEVMMSLAIRGETPSVLCLSRQKLPLIAGREQHGDIARGGWIVRQAKDPDYVIFATGSEVSLGLDLLDRLAKDGKEAQLVSMPCWEIFFAQDPTYQEQVLRPHHPRRIAIEAGSSLGWEKIVGRRGLIIGIDHFGASAPAEELAKEFGFSVEAIMARIKSHWS